MSRLRGLSWFVLGLAAVCSAAGPAGPVAAASSQTLPSAGRDVTVLYLLRHAEAVPPPHEESPPDPPLTEAGRARADGLARLLGGAGIDRILSSDFRRARETAGPLASALGLEVEVYDPRALEELAGRLKGRPGRHVIVGHSNTTPRLVELLGGDPGSPIDERREFDRLYIMMLDPDGGATTMQLRYGEPYQPAAADNAPRAALTRCEEPRPEICTMHYDPVCGRTSAGQDRTYSNGCSACSEPAVVEYRPGPCQ